jgi:hypothetical protein
MMGNLIEATCSNCEFSREFSFGAGMADHTYNCSVPAIYKDTGKFTVKNYYKKASLTETIIFYDDPSMYSGEIIDQSLEMGKIALNPTNNFCPRCKHFSMNFEIVADFD